MRAPSMERLLVLLTVSATAAGCQMRSPLAAFGPPTVPAPTTLQSAPYYLSPSAATSRQAALGSRSGGSRLSVSAEGNSSPPLARSAARSEPADREPIRIVENPSMATRTAAVPTRSTTAPSTGVLPTMPQPPGSRPKGAAPGSVPPPANSPTGKMPVRHDAAVMPAAYQQAAPAFVEPPAPAGQWRAR